MAECGSRSRSRSQLPTGRTELAICLELVEAYDAMGWRYPNPMKIQDGATPTQPRPPRFMEAGLPDDRRKYAEL